MLSVVVAVWSGGEGLRRALDALAGSVPAGTEILAVSGGVSWTAELERRFPAVRHLRLPEDATVPAMRAAGLAAATGDVVALTEDHCAVEPGWADAVLQAHRAGHAVVAGVIDIAPEGSLLDLAVYLFDYSAFVPDARETGGLSGANASFDRAALEALRPAWAGGFVEFAMEAAIRTSGRTVFRANDARVIHHHRYSAAAVTRKFFLGGRWFGGVRRGEIGGRELLMRIAAGPAVPAILTVRVARRISRRRGFLLRYSLAFPWLIWLAVVWSLGEGIGYVAGAGNSSLHWK